MKKLTLLLGLIILASCTPKKNSVRSTVATANGVELNSSQCASNTQNGVGTIYDSTYTSWDFNSRVKAFLSADINPNEVGYISSSPTDASTGVRFSGKLKVDGSGNIVSAQSSFQIKVYDSNVSQANGIPEITLTFDPSTSSGAQRGVSISGQFDSAGSGTVLVRDNLGEVKLQGTVTAQNFSGTVTFVNSQNISGGAGLSGTLGQFFIERCSILK